MTDPKTFLIDTHCHLTVKDYNQDREQVIERALESGVQKIVVPGLDLESSQEAIGLAEAFPSVYAAVGIHPHNASKWDSTYKERLQALAKSSRVIAIGEIGLDFYRNLSPKDVQLEVFKSQLEIAAVSNLPVIIHNREATSDIIDILGLWSEELGSIERKRGVLHAFSADLTTALQMIDDGFYIGIAGPITYKNANSLREIVRKVPLSRILIETDAPYLTPHPYRGKRNEPANVTLVAEHLSDLLKQDYKSMAQRTSENAMGLFGLRNGTSQSALH